MKAVPSRQEKQKPYTIPEDATTPQSNIHFESVKNQELYKDKSEDDKRIYDAYKVIQTDLQQKRLPVTTSPVIHVSPGGYSGIQEQKQLPNWTVNDVPSSSASKDEGTSFRTATQNPYSGFKDDGLSGPSNFRAKQRLNEVVAPQQLQVLLSEKFGICDVYF